MLRLFHQGQHVSEPVNHNMCQSLDVLGRILMLKGQEAASDLKVWRSFRHYCISTDSAQTLSENEYSKMFYCFSNIHVTSLKIFVFQCPNPMSLSIYIRSIVMKGKPMMDTDLFDSLNDSFELTHKRVHHQWNIKPSHFALDFFSAFTLNFLWLESPDVMKGLFSLQSLQRQTVSLCCHPWHCFKAVTHRGAEMWHPLTVWSDRRMDGRHGWHWLDGAGHEKDAVL